MQLTQVLQVHYSQNSLGCQNRFYNYARLAGQEEKIRAKLEKSHCLKQNLNRWKNKGESVRTKQRRSVSDPEVEAVRAARRAARAERRKNQNRQVSQL